MFFYLAVGDSLRFSRFFEYPSNSETINVIQRNQSLLQLQSQVWNSCREASRTKTIYLKLPFVFTKRNVCQNYWTTFVVNGLLKVDWFNQKYRLSTFLRIIKSKVSKNRLDRRLIRSKTDKEDERKIWLPLRFTHHHRSIIGKLIFQGLPFGSLPFP